MRSTSRLVVSLSFVLAAAPLGAQSAQAGPSAAPAGVVKDTSRAVTDTTPAMPTSQNRAESQPSTAGAPMTGLRAGVHTKETSRPAQVAPELSHARMGQAGAMMVVGLAALIAGAIIGGTPGTVVMVGGAVIGLVGLYDYLQ
jgi:hypothetical protein